MNISPTGKIALSVMILLMLFMVIMGIHDIGYYHGQRDYMKGVVKYHYVTNTTVTVREIEK